ncbi:hypothetical protein VFMJ11_A0132 [Aliivibrio fischeri MJ11]|uniref:Uncharacterized protein n=1 Tax=Aliivibrio fischeri (strain MJ11) TaxID=388396 RepID=B5ESM1_ALIFM|nr:hypothetical protein VFMJ11_A0132 [Aliivibrio fischeri MJ11]
MKLIMKFYNIVTKKEQLKRQHLKAKLHFAMAQNYGIEG